MDFEAVLRTFGEYFEREGIRFAVIGGLAMQAWGASRFTRDIDIVVSRADRDRVIAFAAGLGYETLHVSQGYSNHLHGDASLGRVDFMYVDERTAERRTHRTACSLKATTYSNCSRFRESTATRSGSISQDRVC